MSPENPIEELIHKVAKTLSPEVDEPQTTLLSTASQSQRRELDLELDLKLFLAAIATGLGEFANIQAKGTNLEPELSAELIKLCQEVSRLQQCALESLVEKEPTGLIKERLGISDKAILALYAQASEVYNEARYVDASALFLVITLIDPTIHDAWIALGNATYFCERYRQAIWAYSMASRQEPENPISHLHAAHCYEALKEFDLALTSLETAILVIDENPEYKALIIKAKEHIDHLKKIRSI